MGISEIQNMLGMPGGNPFDQSLNTTDSPSFVDGDFSGNVTAVQHGFPSDTNTYIYNVGGSDWMGFRVAGLTFLGMLGSGINKEISFNGNNNVDINFQVGYNGGRAIDMDGANGNVLFGADASVASGGSFKVFNLGDSHTNTANTEYLKIFAQTNSFKIKPEISGTGTRRDLILQTSYGDSHSNIRLDQYGLLRLRYYNNDHIMIGSGYTQVGVRLYPTSDNTIECGLTTNRWSSVNSVDADLSGTLTVDAITPTTDLTIGDNLKNTHLKGAYVRLYDGNDLQLNIDSSYCTVYGLGIRGSHDNTRPMGYESRIWSEVWQGKSNVRGSFVDASNYGHLSIEPDGDNYLIKANSLGTTADASITIQTSQTSAAGTRSIILDADYNGLVYFFFGGNIRGYWGKSLLQANLQVATNHNFVINRTWNSAAIVFQGFDANITDTASDANSNLLNLKVDGVQKFRVKKDGACTAASFITAGNVDFTGLPTSDPNIDGRLYNDSGTLKISSGGSPPP